MEIWNVGAEVGECPYWDRASQSLYWIDVRKPALHRHDAQGGHLATWSVPAPIGAFALLADLPQALVALSTGLAMLDLESGMVRPIFDPEPDCPQNRLNEGKVSPCGNWFVFGSMHDSDPTRPTGALYAFSATGVLNRLASGLRVANGIAWSPDGALLYFSDSREPAIWVCEWNAASGTISQRRVFASPTEAQGRPDGASVDTEGNYWSAGVSAGRINRFNPDGELVETIDLPVQAPTMPIFNGTSMFVTSHRRCPSPTEWDGSIVKLGMPIMGTNQTRFAASSNSLTGKLTAG